MESLPLWVRSFKKNLINNRQLSFVTSMYISAVTSTDDECELDVLKFRALEPEESTEGTTDQDFVFCFDCDMRSQFIFNIKTARKGKLVAFFPLSREKFKVDGKFQIYESSDQSLSVKRLREKIWGTLEKEEKNQYREWTPDKPKGSSDTLNTFNNQEQSQISPHFGTLVIRPTKSSKYITCS